MNDLYVRFFRMAERRIAEKTGRGVVCFISNYSWLDGLSFTGMRERYLEAFDAIRIDLPERRQIQDRQGRAPTVHPTRASFRRKVIRSASRSEPPSATLVRKAEHAPAETVGFRHLWGQAKREELLKSAEAEPGALYDDIEPKLPLELPFVPVAASEGWFDWPALPDLFPRSFPGVKTSRDRFLVDVDLDRLKARIADYFNADLTMRKSPGAIRQP